MGPMILLGATAVAAIGTSMAVSAAPYEDQKLQMQRSQESRLRGVPALEPRGAMGQRMELMQEMERQMEQARAVDRMTPEQMRNWITEHSRLMERMSQGMQPDGAPTGNPGMPRDPAR